MVLITINMTKAKEISHTKRRAIRDSKYAPHDKIIALNIPGAELEAAEAARQAIREKDAEVQTAIDAATTPDELKAILADFESF